MSVAGKRGWGAVWSALALVSCALVCSCAKPEGAQQAPAAAAQPAGIRYVDHVSAGARPPDGAVLTNPMRGAPAAAKSGGALFTAMNCDGCHGGDAGGWVGPSLADGRWRYGGADEEVFSSIYFGRPKGMPAFGGVLGAAGVWNIVAYLRTLPVPADAPTESWEP